MNERDDVLEIALRRQRLGHHGHLPAGRILRIGASHTVAEVRELSPHIRSVESRQSRRIQRRIPFGRSAMASPALALVEIVSIVQVAGRGCGIDRLWQARDITGNLGNGCVVGEHRRRTSLHLSTEYIGFVGAATAIPEVTQLTLDVCRVLAGDGGRVERCVAFTFAAVACDTRCVQLFAIGGDSTRSVDK